MRATMKKTEVAEKMSLARDDATRIVRFCLAGVGWGSALHEDDLCVLKIARTGPAGAEVQRFEADSFEGALRKAAAAGTLKSSCLEKQISFLARSLPESRPEAGDDLAAQPLRPDPASEALFPTMTATISALVHETQRERGTSSLYLSSGGRLFAEELRRQWRVTDARRADLAHFRQRQTFGLPPTLVRRLDRAEDMLATLDAGRCEVESLQVTAAQVIDRYSNTNEELLSVIDAMAQGSVVTALRPTALAWMALLYAKERTGMERAQLASAFTRDRYFDGQHATVSALIASSDSYLHLFRAAAPGPAGELLRQNLLSEVASAVSEMERVALSKRDGGFGIDPTAWFTNISLKMDLLGDVESAIRDSLSRG
jgi:hypothetical protein